jgi:hypothetical protein
VTIWWVYGEDNERFIDQHEYEYAVVIRAEGPPDNPRNLMHDHSEGETYD